MGYQQNINGLCFAFLLFVTYVYAEVKIINIGGPTGEFKFYPQNITVNQGDTVSTLISFFY
jgi:hypothetical protein